MLYFKHSELVNNYHVSLKTVHNWIDAAKQGKLDLLLHERGNRTYIANNPNNTVTLKQLAEQGKKYRNSRHHKVVSPAAAFYNLYSRRQILDIISNLSIRREIPRKYNYIDGGAANWDNWLKRLEKDDSANLLKGSISLLHANLGSIDLLLAGRKKVNVIDVGVGNALPAKELLGYLVDLGVLNRYIAIDISESMLRIAEQNVKRWFGDKVKFEGHVRDISYERFDDLLVDDMLNQNADRTTNLILLLGATAANFPSFSDILKVVYGSMGSDDLLVYTDKPDTEAARQYFDFNPNPESSSLSPNHRYILDLLNIDETLYDVEMGFDKQKRMRYIRIRLRQSLTIKFKFKKGEREVNLEKGDAILMLRVWHRTAVEIIAEFEKVGFELLQSSLTKDRQYLLTISGLNIKSDTDS